MAYDDVTLEVLSTSRQPTDALALALLRMLADAGVAQDTDTWDLLSAEALRTIFGASAYRAYTSYMPQVWDRMKELAPQLEAWP